MTKRLTRKPPQKPQEAPGATERHVSIPGTLKERRESEGESRDPWQVLRDWIRGKRQAEDPTVDEIRDPANWGAETIRFDYDENGNLQQEGKKPRAFVQDPTSEADKWLREIDED